jgi:hypothetical protein
MRIRDFEFTPGMLDEPPTPAIGALDGARKADDDDVAWPCHARRRKRPDRPQPSVTYVIM